MSEEQVKKIKRRVVDYLHKYASVSQILTIARLLSIKED